MKIRGLMLFLGGILLVAILAHGLYQQETGFGSWINPSPTRWILPVFGIATFSFAAITGLVLLFAKQMPSKKNDGTK